MATPPKRGSGDSKGAPPAKKPALDGLEEIRAINRKIVDQRAAVSTAGAKPAPAASDLGRRFEDLRDVAVSLGTAFELRDILDRTVDGILRVARCDRGYVILVEDDGTYSAYTGRRRDNSVWDRESSRQISGTIFDSVARTREPLIHSDVREVDGLKSKDSILEGKIIAAVCLPIVYEGRLVGVIYADSSSVGPAYSDSDRDVLRLFCALAALAIENAKRQGELRERGNRLEEQNIAMARQLANEFRMAGTVSRSAAMLAVFERIATVAPAEHIFVLIQGESGVGKESLARAIHDRSPRRGGSFVVVNCAGITPTLAADMLFGHCRGAFTGADSDTTGAFEQADGGTLFLDEIGDMPLELQPQILRALQQREIVRVGEVKPRHVDVRVVAATNVDLRRAVDDGVFREDLFYRLCGSIVDIPPLRNRREDIIPLVEYFLARHAKDGEPRTTLSREAFAALHAHSWPGNVRELLQVLDSAILYKDAKHVVHAKTIESEIAVRNPRPVDAGPFEGSLRAQIDRFEESVVRRVLAECAFSVAAAAKVLDLSRQQLYAKIHKYGIPLRSD